MGTFSKLESGSLNGSLRRQMSMRLSRKRVTRNTLTQDKWRSATRKVRVRLIVKECTIIQRTHLCLFICSTFCFFFWFFYTLLFHEIIFMLLNHHIFC